MISPAALIAQVRDAQPLNAADLRQFAQGLADDRVSDAQAGAFAMAVLLRGLQGDGRSALTLAMRDSGQVLQWDLPGPVLDKHSTGGVGDCVSLLLAPALAACGAYVPMLSGRGLGHTGGTLDKLEAIPGYRGEIGTAHLQQVVAQVGCAVVGATPEVAPADRRLYAIRDVSATVESIDLITASILSKKLAAGLGGLVLDVKTGSGAFLSDPAQARALAQALVDTARQAGCPCRALLTDMDQPLATAAGNALEVTQVINALRAPDLSTPLLRVTLALGGELLALGGLANDAGQGEQMLAQVMQNGRAAERFGAMVAALGGPTDLLETHLSILPQAPVQKPVFAESKGYVQAIDTRALGLAVVALGGGRLRDGDTIDPSVGLSDLRPLGASSEAPLARVHAASEAAAEAAAKAVRAAYRIGAAGEVPPLIHERIG